MPSLHEAAEMNWKVMSVQPSVYLLTHSLVLSPNYFYKL